MTLPSLSSTPLLAYPPIISAFSPFFHHAKFVLTIHFVLRSAWSFSEKLLSAMNLSSISVHCQSQYTVDIQYVVVE